MMGPHLHVQINNLVYKTLLIFLIITFTMSCNPKLHMVGVGMRKFNTSLNKYSKNKPYIKY
jgi:hypothetical protein